MQLAMSLGSIRALWPNVADMTDLHKALFVMIVAPVVTEACLTVGRFVSRGLPERHEAAGWVLCGCTRDELQHGSQAPSAYSPDRACAPRTDVITIKNVTVRLIISLIQKPHLTLLAALVELPNNWCNEERDRFMYRSSRRLTDSTSDDPTRIRRNQTLRLRLLHIETTIEIISTIVAAFVILTFGISLNGSDPPQVQQVLLNTAIQVVAECVQSLGCNLYWSVIERQPAMSVPLLRMRGFSVIVTLQAVAVWGGAVQEFLPPCLGRRAESSANWVFLTEEVLSELRNTSRLCATFPEAVGFAKAMC
jgi:hypothetical protein